MCDASCREAKQEQNSSIEVAYALQAPMSSSSSAALCPMCIGFPCANEAVDNSAGVSLLLRTSRDCH